MKLADTIDNSIFCSIGCITEQDNILTLEEYLTYNFNVISKFNKIVIAHTKTENITNSQFGEYCNVWKKLFNDKCIIIERPNLGHTFGFTDLDNTVINEAKRFNPTFIWKSTNDVLITPVIFEFEVENSNFFFLQGHGYTGIDSYYKCNVDLAVNSFKNNGYEYFFPQTNFYITSGNIDYLVEKEYFDALYKKCISDPDYSRNKIQTEYKYLLCEIVLRDFVYRNKLVGKHLINKENYKKLINCILSYRISDSSHKNIMFNECGICHYHYKDADVIEI